MIQLIERQILASVQTIQLPDGWRRAATHEEKHEKMNLLAAEIAAWGIQAFYGFSYLFDLDDEKLVSQVSPIPLTSGHWRKLLRQYLDTRSDITPIPYLLLCCPAQEYADSPTLLPLLMDFLDEHPDRAKQWQWFLDHCDEDGRVEIGPDVWAR
jgi:hypothetical protein